MKAILLPLRLLFLISLGACQKCPFTKHPGSNSPHLEASELAQAQGVYWWELTMPKDINEKDHLVVSYVFSDRKWTAASKGSGYKPGQKVKIFCYCDKAQGVLNVSLVTPELVMRIPIEDRLKDAKNITYPIPIGQSAIPGDLLMKFSTSSVTSGRELLPNEIGFAAFIEKHQ